MVRCGLVRPPLGKKARRALSFVPRVHRRVRECFSFVNTDDLRPAQSAADKAACAISSPVSRELRWKRNEP